MYAPSRVRYRTYDRQALFSSAVFITGIAIFGLIFIFHSPFFQIQTIRVVGQKGFQGKVFALAKDAVPYVFSDITGARATLLSRLAPIDTLDIKRTFFSRKLTISYTLRKPFLTWCKGSLCYGVDREGIIFDSLFADSLRSSQDLRFNDAYFQDIEPGKRIPQKFFSGLSLIIETFLNKGLSLSSLTLDAPFLLRVKSSFLPELRFSFEFPLEDQLEAFFLLIDKLGKEKINALTYIDLRIPNKVYYK